MDGWTGLSAVDPYSDALGLFVRGLGRLLYGPQVYLGWYALKKGMDITLVCLWGLVSLVLLIYDGLGALSGILEQTFHLQWMKVGILVAMPVIHFLAMDFAWNLFKEHERSGGFFKPLFSDAKSIQEQKLLQAQANLAQAQAAYAGYGDPSPMKPMGYSGYGADMSSHPGDLPGAPGAPAMSPFHTGYPQEMYNPADVASSRKQHAACC
eukprot:Skav214949  [mRNA]  locus=scaffold2320:31192:40014:+ [translate_table: standard]